MLDGLRTVGVNIRTVQYVLVRSEEIIISDGQH